MLIIKSDNRYNKKIVKNYIVYLVNK